MSLTPSADDPNRDAELKRAKQDPKSFDADPVKNQPSAATLSGGVLVEVAKEAAKAKEEDKKKSNYK